MAILSAVTRPQALSLVGELQRAANAHDVRRLMTFYAADAVAVSPQFAEQRGRFAIARTWERLFAMFPDCRMEVSDVLVDGERVAILGSVAATDRGGWFGRPPTGGPIRYGINIVCTIADGLIVRDERVYDSAGVAERLDKVRVDRELRRAAGVQRTFADCGAVTSPFWRVAARTVPCRAIGGDFVEVAELPTGELAIAIGDAAGKGPAAALLAALLQGALAAERRTASSPSGVMSRLNDLLVSRHGDARFATCAYGLLTPDGRFVYCNAGHNPPAVVGDDGTVRRLTTGGPLLGAFADAMFDESVVRLRHGDTIVAYTDGVSEACNGDGEELGDERVIHTGAGGSSDVTAVADAVLAAARQHGGTQPQEDDMSVAVVRFDGVGRSEAEEARAYLAATRDALGAATTGLSPAQSTFKPSADGWSIADTVEHLAAVERFFLDVIVPRLRSAPPPPARDPRELDRQILAWEPDRSRAVVVDGRASLAEAPPPIRPDGRWTAAEAVERFAAARAETLEYLRANAGTARLHAVEHPALGPLDAYQWLLFIAAHTDRHLQQLRAIRGNARFPRVE